MVEFALGGHTHDGIHKCAQWLLTNEVDTLAGLLEDNPGYSLKLVGHSLGAGTAALLGMMIHDNAEVRRGGTGILFLMRALCTLLCCFDLLPWSQTLCCIPCLLCSCVPQGWNAVIGS